MVQVEAPPLVGKTLEQGRAAVEVVGLSVKVIGMQPSQGPVIGLDGVQTNGEQEVGVKADGGTTSPFSAQMVTISSTTVPPGEMVDKGGEIGVIIYNPYEIQDKKSGAAQG